MPYRILPLPCLILFCMPLLAQEKLPTPPVLVKIQDEKAIVVNVEPTGPIDPVRRINFQQQPQFAIHLNVENKVLQNGFIHTAFHYEGRVMNPNQVGLQKGALPKTPSGKEREGYYTSQNLEKIKITQTVEVIPTKVQNGTRRRDAVLIKYLMENQDTVPRKIGMRVGMDVFLVDNDGALFASPTTHPKKILDGIELKDKGVPDYIQILQRPNLANPGFVAHLTYALGGGMEKPTRVNLTSLGAGSQDGYHMQTMPANGDSAMYMHWDVKELRPGQKRECAYAYGQGLAGGLSHEGNLRLELGGSFEPGKSFTIAAYINDPVPGQSLQLELPEGMQRLEGKDIEPVASSPEMEETLVLWKARVLRPGQFTIRVVSSTGVTLGKMIAITKNGEK